MRLRGSASSDVAGAMAGDLGEHCECNTPPAEKEILVREDDARMRLKKRKEIRLIIINHE